MAASQLLDMLPELAEALQNGRPVVALESTIIAHGMPYPQNVETALAVEQAVRKAGALPATIAILHGRLKVGLTADELELLGKRGPAVTKCSRRDLPFVVARKGHGATTVAATMLIAHMAGIPLFATGGIGGVHWGAETSMDISADLQELARTPVAVVSAGAKAILDLGLTLEYLETRGVPVIGYRTDRFPAFYVRDSGHELDYRLDSPAEIAELIRLKRELALDGGLLIANPIPEEDELAHRAAHEAIQQAIAEAEGRGITGKALTPFLLARIAKLTGGESLRSNIQLVLHNARLAGEVAVALAGRRGGPTDSHSAA